MSSLGTLGGTAVGGALGGPLGAAVGGAAGAGLASILAGSSGKLSKGKLSAARGYLTAGGLSTGLVDDNKRVTVQSSPERQGLVNQLASVFGGQANQLGLIRGQLTAGRGALTEARLAQLDAGERAALGDLRTNLSRRRVLGSSFANDQQAAIQEQFGRARAEEAAQGLLETYGLDADLLTKQTAAAASQFQTKINELNLQTSVASSILSGSQASVGALADTSAQVAALYNQEILGAGTYSLASLGNALGSLLGGKTSNSGGLATGGALA
jgi:hypothetical protein